MLIDEDQPNQVNPTSMSEMGLVKLDKKSINSL